MLGRGGGAAAARALLVLGSELQVGDGLHQLGLRLLQEPVDVLGTVLGQRCPLLLPVPLGSLRRQAEPAAAPATRQLLLPEQAGCVPPPCCQTPARCRARERTGGQRCPLPQAATEGWSRGCSISWGSPPSRPYKPSKEEDGPSSCSQFQLGDIRIELQNGLGWKGPCRASWSPPCHG